MLHFIIMTLAAARLIRLFSLDKITQPLRDLALKADRGLVRIHVARSYWLTKGLECPWCGGFWAALAAFYTDQYLMPHATVTEQRLWILAVTVFAASWVIGILGKLDGYPEDF